MKKRFLAVVLALVMTAACMTACGGENKTEDKQQTTTTTTAETTTTTTAETTTTTTAETTTTTTAEATTTTTTKAATTTKKATTTTSMPNGKAEYKITTIKVTTTKHKTDAPPEVPQDVNPGQWREDPGITKADLKAAAEAAFAKVKKTAIEYGWKIAETLVNRNTDTQYGIYCKVEISAEASATGQYEFALFTIKSEKVNNGIRTTFGAIPLGGPVGSKNSDDYPYCDDISYLIEFLKKRGY